MLQCHLMCHGELLRIKYGVTQAPYYRHSLFLNQQVQIRKMSKVFHNQKGIIALDEEPRFANKF